MNTVRSRLYEPRKFEPRSSEQFDFTKEESTSIKAAKLMNLRELAAEKQKN